VYIHKWFHNVVSDTGGVFTSAINRKYTNWLLLI